MEDRSEYGKITAKGQTTVPKEVRKALFVREGDMLEWDITMEGGVYVRKANPIDYAYARALEPTLSEWATKEDDEAYGDL